MSSHCSSSLSSFENDQASVSGPGSRSLALSLALVPSLLIAGGLHAVETAAAPEDAGNAGPKRGADKDVVELEPLEVQASAERVQLSSPKFTQPLVDVPQTFAVISSEIFNQQGAQNLSDVLRNTPGITFTAGETGNVASGDTFTMRGFDTSNSIFVDSVRSSGAYNRDIYNTEQVEIAKGPAGADNGRGGTSGYVNLATKRPGLENFSHATTSYGVSEGGEDQRRATIDLNRSLGDVGPLRGAAVRLNIYGQDSGVPGRDHVENTGYGFAPSLALGLGTPTRVFISGSYESQDNLPDSGVPAVGVGKGLYLDPAGAPDVLVPVQSPIGKDITDNFYGFANHDYEHVTTRSALVRIEHDITPDLRLSNQTKVAEAKRDAISSFIANAAAYDPVSGQITLRRGRTLTDNTVISNQTNLVTSFDTGPIAHDLSVGLEFTRESQFSPTFTANTAGGTQDILNPDPNAVPAGDPTYAPNSPFNKGRIDTAAIHVFDTIHLTDKLMLNLGGRLEHYQIDAASLAADTTLPLDTTPVRLEGSDTLFSYKAGIVYKPTRHGSLYAAYGNSFTPPGTNFTLSSQAGNANDPATDPQEAHNYEVGVKWEFFESRLSTSLAFFRSVNENVATNIGTSAVPIWVYDTEQRTEGVELGISGRITPRWLVYGGISYMESETSSQNASNGADLRFTPKLSANLWTTYALFKRFTIGGGVQYSESVSRSTSNTVAGSTTNAADSYLVVDVPSYWVFNALAEYAVTKNIAVRLNVNNLFDEDYYRINNNGGRFYPGASRTFVLSADFKF